MKEEDLKGFIQSSITDIQGTIRAIDTKLSFLLAFMIAPLAALPTIISTIIDQKNNTLFLILIIASTALWIITVLIISQGLTSVGNPAEKLKKSSDNTYQPKGIYYSGNLFGGVLNFQSSVLSPKNQLSRLSLDEHFNNLSDSNINETKELTFEQMKLCYIRDLKIHRQKWALKFAFTWGIASFVSILNFTLAKF